jgi:TPR repeat protein/tRNA A-37 threonylcarbamoyl transferase component Bud32
MTENANIDRKCERCGAPLAADAPEGLCPRCLMALNLATQTEAPGAEVGPGGTQRIAPKPESAPPLEEIARQFPQLEVLECLGRGGMGVVYKARQPRLNRFVALKILAREKEKDPRFAERFTREAQALARLNHPNIVTVYDFGETNGLYYLLMEFVDGMNLRQLLQTRKLAPEEALAIVPSICEALQYAHQLGIVHRDIKPENILLDKEGRVKIADYGIAKLVGADGRVESLTGDQHVVGTPHYMAPEQVEKPSVVDHRADIFSLGVVFYEMLTGELPLGKFAPPSRMVKMDVRLDEVVLHALEKEPELRYQQASQVKTDVETIARTEAGSEKSQPGRTQPPPVAVAAPAIENVWRQVKGPGTGLVVTAILNWLAIPLIFLIVAGVVARRGGPPSALLLVVPLSALVLSSIMLAAGLMMKRLGAYALAIAGAILAILVTPGNLIGLPIGIWALVVLSRREVREAFGKGLPMPPPALGQPSRGGGAWKVVAVIVAAVMLVLAIPVCAILFAIALPAYSKARSRARLVQEQIKPHVPTFVVRGTVSDATTGIPIPGARVDDNAYGARPNRAPQQAWTDAQGHYELRTWAEEHTLAASASAYQTKLFTRRTTQGLHLQRDGKVQIDFQLQPAEAGGQAASAQEIQAFDETVKGGSEAWSFGDYSKALKLLLPAAQRGHPVAQHRLGVMYVMGQGVPQDYAEATRWFRKAAEQGQGESQYSMGLRYQLAQSVAQDDKEAARWFKLAAEQGIGAAAEALAEQYAKGEGVTQDLVETYKWAAVASDQPGPANGGITTSDLESQLTPDQLAEAQRRAKEFVPKRTGPADP